ncbi:uncharacterized protein [Leptinotarsa decemlineata]|uniref:uncharacterized protein n=1 Tax=Leptinotarsa decemlineata TaxID=7539 RepID=UPI003D304659
MGKLLAVALALILVCNGQQIFRETVPIEAGPLLSLYTFMAAIFLLLYDLRLYPTSLRKLDGFGQTFIEFLVSAFLMENIMLDFWIPLIATITQEMLPNFADFLDETMLDKDWNCADFCDFIKSDTFATVISYVLSIFFLIAVLHAIRAIDLRAFEDGPGCFFGDIFFRVKRFFRRKLRSLGFGVRKRVKIRESIDKKNGKNKSNNVANLSKNKDPCLGDDKLDEYDRPDNEVNDNYQMGDNDSCGDFSEFDMANDL